jgi:hypothetical protein
MGVGERNGGGAGGWNGSGGEDWVRIGGGGEDTLYGDVWYHFLTFAILQCLHLLSSYWRT